MFKFFTTQFHKAKKGFTLIELIVTLFLLAIVAAMTAQVAYGVFNNYQLVQKRWKMQNEVNYIMKMFEGNKEALTTSRQADIFYDLDCSSVPADGETDPDEIYSYFYAKPIDKNDLSQGYNLWYRDRKASESYQLNNTDIPIGVEFSIPVEPNPLVTSASGEVTPTDNEQGYETVSVPVEDKVYQKSTLTITISATGYMKDKYSLSTSFTLVNMLGNQQINYSFGEPVDPNKKPDGTPMSNVYLAGWTNNEINSVASNKANEYPVKFSGEAADGVPYEQHAGNVIRFVSIESFLSSQNPSSNNMDMVNKCFISKLFMGTSLEVPIKGAFRDFRDNVLSKTDIGCKIINEYYTVWSPKLNSALSEHPDLVKAVGRIAAVPVAIVAYFTASE